MYVRARVSGCTYPGLVVNFINEWCFEIVLRDYSLEEEFFGQFMGSVPIQNRVQFRLGSYCFVAVIPV